GSFGSGCCGRCRVRTLALSLSIIALLQIQQLCVTGTPSLVPCTLALGDDASGCFLLPREVRNRCARMVISVGNVNAMVHWVNRDLEKVSKAAVGAAS